MCGNCNCGHGSAFCLDEKMIFIVLLIFLFAYCGNGCGLGGLFGGCGDSCGCERSCGC